jgi:hypothetical protein
MDRLESLAEQRIREAQERGEFDNLPSAGKPLPGLETDDPDWWVKGMIRREGLDMADALPPVIALRREAAGFPESLLALHTEQNVREVLEDYNHRVRLDRLRPAVGPFPPMLAKTVDVDEIVAQWHALRSAPAGDVEVPGAGEHAADEPGAKESTQVVTAAGTSRAVRPDRASWIRRLLGRS